MGDGCREAPGTEATLRAKWLLTVGLSTVVVMVLTACGGGNSSSSGGGGTGGSSEQAPWQEPAIPTSVLDAHRLAQQGSFGVTEVLSAEIEAKGPRKWVAEQMALSTSPTRSVYTSGGSADVHQVTDRNDFCTGQSEANCWRDHFSTYPVLGDFYRNAMTKPDQLRQRVAFAMQQWLVVSGHEVSGTYGFRNYHNMLLENAFGNYRTVLRKVALSPVMGDFLNNANNDKAAPNENFARELMQLFAIGVCELNLDGSLKGGECQPTYDNEVVRNMAYALTGWTYPVGGATKWGCPKGQNCRYYEGDMVPAPAFHDAAERRLLSGLTVPAGSTPELALERVLDSLMQHPNLAPFVARHFIQNLVMSNPSPAYVSRVARAFAAGRFDRFGQGQPGDLAATIAAVLLDQEARTPEVARKDGQLREPVLLFTGVLRGLGSTLADPGIFSYWMGDLLLQRVFDPPSVFNFYPPDYALVGSGMPLVGPAFGIHNASTAMERMRYLNCVIDWGGCTSVTPNEAAWVEAYLAAGTPAAGKSNVNGHPADTLLVDRLSRLAYGQLLPSDERQAVLDALKMQWSTPQGRFRQAAYLIFASPRYQLNL